MKKVIVLSHALLFALLTSAQTETKPMHPVFGIDLGANYSTLAVSSANVPTVKKVTTGNQAGYRLGLVMDVPVSKHFTVNAGSDISFYSNKVNVYKTDNSTLKYEMPPCMEAAVHIAYKINRKSVSPYISLGPSYKVPLVTNDATLLQVSKSTIAADMGIGFQKAFPSFIIAPELRYSYGLNNISNMAGVTEARLNNVAFILNFKGTAKQKPAPGIK